VKKYLFNNAVALAVHALIVAAFFLLQYSLVINDVTMMVVPFWAYIICGFFLKPVERFSFLSVISVAAVIAIAWVCFFLFRLGTMYPAEWAGLEYIYFTPIALELAFPRYFSATLGVVLWFASPIIPSLIMYAGIVLRKFIKRRL